MLSSLFRKLPVFKGKRRLASLLINRDIPNHQDEIIEGKMGCSFKLPNIKENIGFEIFINGIYEKQTIDFIISKLPVGGNMVDIGANIGTIVIPVCNMRPDIKAYAFEASGRVFEYLRINKEINKLGNCTIIHKAVTDSDGEKVDFYSPVEQYGKGCMINTFTDDAETIETVSLDSFVKEKGIGKIDFIKIDIEGYEYFAFKGAENILKTENAPTILFEFAEWAEDLAKGINIGDAQKLLMSYGYKLYSIDDNGKLSALQAPLTKGIYSLIGTKQKL